MLGTTRRSRSSEGDGLPALPGTTALDWITAPVPGLWEYSNQSWTAFL